MAYVPQQIPENEANLLGRKEQTTPNPIPPQTGGSAGGGTGGTGGTPGVGTSTQFGSNAAKLSDYLNANKEQVGQFGQQVAGNLNQGYQSALGGINQGISGFNEQVGQGYRPVNQEMVNQAATNPSEFVKNPENTTQFQNWYQGKYTGPQNFEGTGFYGNINDQVNKAVENANLVNSYSGLKTYLSNSGYNDTTEGMRALDTALLQGNPGAISSIRSAAKPYENLNQYLNEQVSNANKNVQETKNNAIQASEQLKNKFTGQGGTIPTYEQDFINRLNAARNTATTNAGLANEYITNPTGNITAQVAEQLGLTPEQIKTLQLNSNVLSGYENINNPQGNPYISNFNLLNYANPTSAEAAILPENFANAQDYANIAALQQLTGNDLTSFLNQQNVGEAGTAPKSLMNFNINEALTGTSQQVRNTDKNFVNDTFKGQFDLDHPEEFLNNPIPGGVNNPYDQEWAGSLVGGTGKDYFDSIVGGGYTPSNPNIIKAIHALIREGVYTPPDVYQYHFS